MKLISEQLRAYEDRIQITSECWNWTGYKNAQGYGQARYKGKVTRSNRLAWILTYGDIPKGLLVCHKCDNTSCVRPDHLFLGTYLENNRDRDKKNRFKHHLKQRTHCKQGHPFGNNPKLYENKRRNSVSRVCQVCVKIRNDKRKALTDIEAILAGGGE